MSLGYTGTGGRAVPTVRRPLISASGPGAVIINDNEIEVIMIMIMIMIMISYHFEHLK